MHIYEQDALDFVNEVRAEQDEAPLSELPKGIPGSAMFCPIAQGITGAWVSVGPFSASYYVPFKILGIRMGTKRRRKQLSMGAAMFVRMFDFRQIPKLIDRTPDTFPADWLTEESHDQTMEAIV